MKARNLIFTAAISILTVIFTAGVFANEQAGVFEQTYVCDCVGNEDNSLFLVRTLYEGDWRMAIYAFANGLYNTDIRMHLIWDKATATASIRGLTYSPFSKNFYFTSAFRNGDDDTTPGLWQVSFSDKNIESFKLYHEHMDDGIGYLLTNKKGVWLLKDEINAETGEWWNFSNLYQIEDDNGRYLFKKPDSAKGYKFHSFVLFESDKANFPKPANIKYEMNAIFQSTDYALLICDTDKKSWWVYDCIAEIPTKYESFTSAFEAAQAIDRNYEAELALSAQQENGESPATSRIILQILALVCFVVTLLFFVYLIIRKIKQDKKNASALIERNKMIFDIQEAERAKISRDIHDSVVQDIRVLRLETENLVVDDASKQRQTKIEDIATDCIIKLRNICYNLTPAELATHNEGDSSKLELISIINSLVQQFSSRTHIPCVFKVDEGFEYPVLEKEKTQNLFRVIQEALTNIEKHSYATQASIFIKKDGSSLIIYVTDDGIGCNPEDLDKKLKSKEHLGLRSMKDRMELIGGSIEFFTAQNDGMEIKLQLPLENAE
ncbi:MAG: sensor histidine kinase [Spirochaetaceae bacterium]|nr:sensor histidine kinase [Spirochaetaceae bacterium]